MSARRPEGGARRWRRGLAEAAALALLAVIFASVLQAVRTHPLPLELPPAAWALESDAVWVSADQARRLYRDAHDLLFVDVREQEEFVRGHVPGALNLPAARLHDLYDAFAPWARGQRLLIYGSARDAGPVDDVLLELEDLGHTNLLVLVGGWDSWRAGAGAVEDGTDGILVAEEEALW